MKGLTPHKEDRQCNSLFRRIAREGVQSYATSKGEDQCPLWRCPYGRLTLPFVSFTRRRDDDTSGKGPPTRPFHPSPPRRHVHPFSLLSPISLFLSVTLTCFPQSIPHAYPFLLSLSLSHTPYPPIPTNTPSSPIIPYRTITPSLTHQCCRYPLLSHTHPSLQPHSHAATHTPFSSLIHPSLFYLPLHNLIPTNTPSLSHTHSPFFYLTFFPSTHSHAHPSLPSLS